MSRIEVAGASWNVVEAGNGPVLLLVHGFPLDHSMWEHQLGALSARFRVIAPDLGGFGASLDAGGESTMERFADALAAHLDALAVDEPIAFGGLSMGGYVAWEFCRRHAERLGKLILCDTRAAADSDDVARGRLDAAEHVLAEGSTGFVEAMIGKLFAEQTVRQRPDAVDRIRRVMLGTAAETVAAGLRGMARRTDMTAALGQVAIPTLILCGREDVISPPDEMRSIAAAMPNARFAEVPGAGHMAPLENPRFVNQAITEFLARPD